MTTHSSPAAQALAAARREEDLAEALEAHTLYLERLEVPRAGRKALQKLAGDPEFEALRAFIALAREIFASRPAEAVPRMNPIVRAHREETVLAQYRAAFRTPQRGTTTPRAVLAARPLPAGADSELAQVYYAEPDELDPADTNAPRPAVVGAPVADSPRRSDALRVYLEVVEDGKTVREVETTLYEAVFGRSDVSYRIEDDMQVSRRHARLLLLDGHPVVSDLGSRNGTFVDGLRILEPTPLYEGSVLEVGRTRLVLDRRELVGVGHVRVTFSSESGAYGVDLSECVLGRGRDVAIPLRDPTRRLSRRHARLDMCEGQVFLTDLGSTNGVRVAGARVEGSVLLEPDMVLYLGSVQVRVAGFTRV
jgi:pSer/pThr/pTyr-binding forkhead associated (FHA) protein